MLKVYGLEKCSTCDKARKWLDKNKVNYQFIDYRDHRLPAETLKDWAGQLGGWEKLVNRTSMTWRNLPPPRKDPRTDPEWTLLIKEYPVLVRRPAVVRDDGAVSVGFTDKQFAKLFSA